jgi:hypothetical protein
MGMGFEQAGRGTSAAAFRSFRSAGWFRTHHPAVLDKGEAQKDDADRSKALAALNVVLAREGWEAFYTSMASGSFATSLQTPSRRWRIHIVR